MNKDRFPKLARCARKYLSPPPSSVASEQWFSTVADIYHDKKRYGMKLDTLRRRAFLMKALPAVNFTYELCNTDIQNVTELQLNDDDCDLEID